MSTLPGACQDPMDLGQTRVGGIVSQGRPYRFIGIGLTVLLFSHGRLSVAVSGDATSKLSIQVPPKTEILLPKNEQPKGPGKGSSAAKLSLGNSQYLSANQTYFRKGATSHDTALGLEFTSFRKWNSRFSHGVNLKNQFSTVENWNYFKPLEAYVGWKTPSMGSGQFGRKLKNWSSWEQNWQQGLFQPRYMDNKMHPEMAGLTGLFGDFRMGKWNGSFALLPIHLPEFGPHHYVHNHQFVSENPWFNPPPKKFNLGRGTGDIRYEQNVNVKNIIFNPGFAMLVEQDFKSWSSRISVAYKPMTQLLLGFPSFERVVIATDDYMKVQVEPRVVYQKVLSTDAEYRKGSWTFVTSGILELPDRDDNPENSTTQQVKDAVIVAGSASRPLLMDGPRAPRVTLGFMKLWGGDASDRGYFASDKSLFERRYQYVEAFSLGLSANTSLFKYSSEHRVRAIYDTFQNGGTLSLSSGVDLANRWQANLSLDFIGLLNQNGRVKDGYLNAYRANDRLNFGMSYVY